MEKVPQKSGLRLWCGTVGLALVILVMCPQRGQAQTNTFPPTGNVGIGTTTPGSLLEVKQSQNAGTTVVIDNGHTAASNAAYSGVFFKQGGASRFFFGSINDGNTNQNGGAGGVQFWNYANAPILFATNNAERVRIDAAGNVGIGTTAPNYRLEILGASSRNILALTGDGDSVGYAGLRIQALTTTGIAANRTSTFNLHMRKDSWYGGDGSGPTFIIETTSKTGGYAAPFVITATNDIILNSGVGNSGLSYGNVGIGKTAPVYKLDVNGEINATGFRINGTPIATGGASQWTTTVSPATNIYFNTGNVGIGTTTPASALEVGRNAAGTPWGLTITGGSTVAAPILYFNYADAGTNLKRWLTFTDINGAFNIGTQPDAGGVATPKMFISNAGNVGFGTTSPSLQSGTTNKIVEIKGSLNPGLALTATSAGGRQFYLYSSQTNPGYFSIFDAAANADRFVVRSSGNVGIGSSDPQSALQIGTQASAATDTPVRLSLGGTFSSAAGSNLKLRLYDDGVLGNTYGIGVSTASMDFGVSSTAGYNWYSGGAHKMTLTTGGNVGIGLPNPSEKLEVSGNLKVSGAITGGTINAKYQDVAEWVESSQALSAGTVVVLDHTRSNQVVASSQAYDTRVAGVISLQPGIALGESGAGKVLVATTGRVRIKVDATAGAIQIGDLLVTSDVPGVAMKSEPIKVSGRLMHMPGTLVGKALEPLEKGTGEILVLLSLQ